jgi:hypothetical protein
MKRYRPQHEHNAEAALMREGAKYFREAFPNPDRIGCPGSATLEALGARSAGADTERAVTDHLTCCSPCFLEYEALVHRRRERHRVKVFAAAAAAVVMISAIIWLSGQWRHTAPIRETPGVAKSRPAPAPSDPAPEVAVLDFQNEHRYRGQNPPPQRSASRQKYQLPPRRLALTIYLPIGNEEGSYEIEILNSAGAAVLSRNVEGRLRNHVLTIQLDLDLRALPAGQYIFLMGRNGFHLEEYPLTITSPPR